MNSLSDHHHVFRNFYPRTIPTTANGHHTVNSYYFLLDVTIIGLDIQNVISVVFVNKNATVQFCVPALFIDTFH